MAAMVERPTSVLNDMSTPDPSMEIIDVDAFEDEGLNLLSDLEESSSLTTFNSPPVMRSLDRGSRRTTPQTIDLLDSDDEAASGSGITNPGQSSNRRRLLSPPPRNVPVSTIPPVPPVPPRFAGHTSFPMRFQPPPFPSPAVIRPISRSLSFENALDAPIAGPSNHRLRRRNDISAPQAGPPSHHVPSMGLGGAIISSHRSGNSTFEPHHAPPVTTGGQSRMPSFASGLVEYSRWVIRRTNINSFFGDDSDIDDFFGDEGSEHLFAAWQDAALRQRQSIHEKEQYLPSYTHPSKPELGFTFDFALPTANTRTRLFPPTSINNPIVLDDDDDNSNESFTAIAGPSSSSTSDTGQVIATLVCANCSDLLLLNAALHPNESDRRVWGLRCGHIIDEKCLNQLGQPRQVVEDMPDHTKGKASATDSGRSYGDTTVSENQTVLEAVQENSIRSRLRSRPSTTSIPPMLDSSPPNRLACKRRRISNKKKKVEAEYSWMCPVPNCCRVHVSVKVDGVWGPEREREFAGGKTMSQPEGRGAIPIFA